MRNIPVDLRAFRLMVSEEPAVKMRQNGSREQEPATDRDGVIQYSVSLFMKTTGQRGEEIRVTLPADPGEGFEEGTSVELVGAAVSPYQFTNDRGETVAGVAWRAEGLKPLRPARAAA